MGEVNTKKDLYDAAFSVAKKLVDDGATDIVVDGVSLGGAVGAKIAVKLQEYCKKNHKKVAIKHFNSVSFSSTKDYALGFVREFNLVGKNKFQRSPANFFEKCLSHLFSPLVSLVLKLTDWDMNPKDNLKRMPDHSYEIISTKGDFVIGTYASMEKQFRKRNLQEIKKLQREKAQLEKKLQQFEGMDNFAAKHAKREPNSSVKTTIAQLKNSIIKIDSQIASKKNRLCSTDETKDFSDGQATPETDTHNSNIPDLPSNFYIDQFSQKTKRLDLKNIDFTELYALVKKESLAIQKRLEQQNNGVVKKPKEKLITYLQPNTPKSINKNNLYQTEFFQYDDKGNIASLTGIINDVNLSNSITNKKKPTAQNRTIISQ